MARLTFGGSVIESGAEAKRRKCLALWRGQKKGKRGEKLDASAQLFYFFFLFFLRSNQLGPKRKEKGYDPSRLVSCRIIIASGRSSKEEKFKADGRNVKMGNKSGRPEEKDFYLPKPGGGGGGGCCWGKMRNVM